MNKISCDVIKDLLPLYKDDVCSDKSRKLVEAHLTECDDCREYLDSMDAKLPPVVMASDTAGARNDNGSDAAALDAMARDIRFFKKIARRITSMKITVCIFVLVIAVLIISIIPHDLLLRVPGFDRRIAAEDIRISELYQLEDGDLYFTLESDIPFQIPSYISGFLLDASSHSRAFQNNAGYVSFKKCSFLERFLLERPYFYKSSFVIPLEEVVYYEGKENEQLIIWETGQEIDAAPNQVEERVLHERNTEKYGSDYSDDYEEAPEYEDGILFIE